VNRKRNGNPSQKVVVAIAAIVLTGCASGDVFSDSNMDFASLRSVAVMPFTNLS
jgi:outer membrane lipoprotein SlyB